MGCWVEAAPPPELPQALCPGQWTQAALPTHATESTLPLATWAPLPDSLHERLKNFTELVLGPNSLSHEETDPCSKYVPQDSAMQILFYLLCPRWRGLTSGLRPSRPSAYPLEDPYFISLTLFFFRQAP